MNIEITEEEHEKLLDLLSIAESVLTGHKDADERTEPYVKVVQKFYDLAKETDQSEKIAFDRDLSRYIYTKARDESSEIRKMLDEYVDETFWHELIYRFTERDLERQLGGYDNVLDLPQEERFAVETSIEERYLEEFEEHGIDRLEIVEQFAPGPGQKTSD